MNIEIREVIKRILGDIVVHCETYHDKEVYQNVYKIWRSHVEDEKNKN